MTSSRSSKLALTVFHLQSQATTPSASSVRGVPCKFALSTKVKVLSLCLVHLPTVWWLWADPLTADLHISSP